MEQAYQEQWGVKRYHDLSPRGKQTRILSMLLSSWSSRPADPSPGAYRGFMQQRGSILDDLLAH